MSTARDAFTRCAECTARHRTHSPLGLSKLQARLPPTGCAWCTPVRPSFAAAAAPRASPRDSGSPPQGGGCSPPSCRRGNDSGVWWREWRWSRLQRGAARAAYVVISLCRERMRCQKNLSAKKKTLIIKQTPLRTSYPTSSPVRETPSPGTRPEESGPEPAGPRAS